MEEDIFNEGRKVIINQITEKLTKLVIENELLNESICPECDIEMNCTKGKRSNGYKKHSTVYDCPVCGYHHRKRTVNEIMRDIGEEKITYRNFIIENNDYPHPDLKYKFSHKDDTDGGIDYGSTIDECKMYIDSKLD